MARRPLPRILSKDSAQIARTQIARSRELARTAADGATDVLHPLITISRGLGRLAGAGRGRWAETPKDKRGPLLFLTAAVILVVALMPYGPLLAVIVLMTAAAWHGRDRTPPVPQGPDASQTERLRSLYEALVPSFTTPDDPAPLYTHGGDWEKALVDHDFDDTGRVGRLAIRYPAYFPDGEPECRARIEQLLTAKAGRGREYRFAWDEEGNRLTLSVLDPLPTGVAAQRFVTAPGETVLGFTDPSEVQRTLPLSYGEEQRDVPPVVWRTGVRSTEPHLLAMGHPGSGTSTLLRSIALQALQHGDVLVVDGGGTGEYACLTGREGVLAVECTPAGAVTGLEWAAQETERRLIAINRARQAGEPMPEEARRPLWLLLDRPTVFTHLAEAEHRTDPQALLQVPLRHGRAANVTVVVAEQFDSVESLSEAVGRHTRARVVLGPATPEQVAGVLGAPPHSTPPEQAPAGRGYARLGSGPVHRLQVPSTPDPYDDAASEDDRQAVLTLLPPRTAPLDAEAAPDEPAGTADPDPREHAAGPGPSLRKDPAEPGSSLRKDAAEPVLDAREDANAPGLDPREDANAPAGTLRAGTVTPSPARRPDTGSAEPAKTLRSDTVEPVPAEETEAAGDRVGADHA